MDTKAMTQGLSMREVYHDTDGKADGDKQRADEGSIEVRDEGDEGETEHIQRVLEEDNTMASMTKFIGEGTSTNTVQASMNHRIPYNSGFGDFCFGRFLDHSFTRKTRNIDEEVTANVTFEELKGFQRQGPFPFFKLPIEIRFKVYGFFLLPFYSYDYYAGLNSICIELKSFTDHREFWGSWHTGDYAQYLYKVVEHNTYLKACKMFVSKLDPSEMTEQELKAGQIVFEEEKRLEELQNTPHPSRSSPYLMTCYAPLRTGQPSGVDWSMLELLRKLSNVSAILRYELGAILWSKASINCHEFLSPLVLRAFLDDRPMAASKIRHIRLKVVAEDGYWTEDGKELSVYQNMSKALKLDTLALELDISEDLFIKLAKQEIPWFSVFRSFKVSQGFELTACVFWEIDGAGEDSDGDFAERVYHEPWRVGGELLDDVKDFLMPDTLRAAMSLASD